MCAEEKVAKTKTRPYRESRRQPTFPVGTSTSKLIDSTGVDFFLEQPIEISLGKKDVRLFILEVQR